MSFQSRKEEEEVNEHWQETPNSWIDLRTGLEWSKEFKSGISYYNAEDWAKEQCKRLPTRDEFIEAEKNGILWLQNIDWKSYWFWSNTVHPSDSDFLYIFNGDRGSGNDYNYINSGGKYDQAARCVTPVGGQSVVSIDLEISIPYELNKTEKSVDQAWEKNR